jgi:hypothetical protein
MMPELRIQPVPIPGGGLMLMLRGGNLPTVGKQVQRTLLQLDTELLDRFRRAEISEPQTKQLSDAVTNWLLDADIRSILAAALPANAGGLRLVVEVSDEARPIVLQMPLELLWHDTPDMPLVLRKDVATLAYVLPKVRAGVTVPARRGWPFKVLFVRAFPPDLPPVPEVAGLAKHIQQCGAHYGQGMVQVDVLSREADVGKAATWMGLRQHLKNTSDYNVLVYLGHGELVPSVTGTEPIGQLFFESEDGGGHQPINAPQFAKLLRNYPIGVVVLAGCVTGMDAAGAARQRGGEQGVAQALVNSSEAGVEVAVAMRTELRIDAAATFLRAFFEALLNATPDAAGNLTAGNIDCAVRAARNELFLDTPVPPQWAAPIVLRANEQEPFLDFLAQPVMFRLTETMTSLLALRSTLRKGVADYSLAQGVPELIVGKHEGLDEIEQMIRTEGLKQGPLLLPHDVTAGAGQQQVASFELAGVLTVVKLSGRVATPPGVSVRVLPMPAAAGAAFQLVTDPNNLAWFELRSKSGNPGPLPQGEVLQAHIEVAAATAPGVYPLTLELQQLEPAGVLWPDDGIVIVPRP